MAITPEEATRPNNQGEIEMAPQKWNPPAFHPVPVDLSKLQKQYRAHVHLAVTLGGKVKPPGIMPIVSMGNDQVVWLAAAKLTDAAARYMVEASGRKPTPYLIDELEDLYQVKINWPVDLYDDRLPDDLNDKPSTEEPAVTLEELFGPQYEPPTTRVVEEVSRRSAKAKTTTFSSNGEMGTYDSEVVWERTWPDGTIDFECKQCGKGGFLTLRSAGAHAGMHSKIARGTNGRGGKRQPKLEPVVLPPIEETAPTLAGRSLADGLQELVTLRRDMARIRDIVAPGYDTLRLERDGLLQQVQLLNEQLDKKDSNGVLAALRDLIDKEIR